MSTVLLPFGVVALLVLVWVELPLLDRWVFGRYRDGPPRRYQFHGNRTQLIRLLHRHRPVEPACRPIQLVAADLRRLSRQMALVPAGAPLVRWRALWSAYDGVLTEAAAQLEIPHALPDAPVGMARDIERIRVVAALEGAGLVVHG